MDNESHKQNQSLAKFHLAFEYDKTWQEAKKAVKSRVASQ